MTASLRPELRADPAVPGLVPAAPLDPPEPPDPERPPVPAVVPPAPVVPAAPAFPPPPVALPPAPDFPPVAPPSFDLSVALPHDASMRNVARMKPRHNPDQRFLTARGGSLLVSQPSELKCAAGSATFVLSLRKFGASTIEKAEPTLSRGLGGAGRPSLASPASSDRDASP